MSQSAWHHVRELFMDDSRHWSARLIGTCSSRLHVERDTLVVGASVFVSVLLILDRTGQLVANSLLVISPLISTFVYPDERPSNASLVIYWSTFGLFTVLDTLMTSTVGWHLLKIGLMCVLFVRPIYLAGYLVVMFEQRNPQAQRTLSQIFSRVSLLVLTGALFRVEDLRDLRRQSSESAIHSMVGPTSCEATQSESTSTMSTITSETVASQIITPNGVQQLPSPGNTPNPGEVFVDLDRSRLESFVARKRSAIASEGDGFAKSSDLAMMRVADIHFEPTNRIVFNAPFELNNTTCRLRMHNTTRSSVAYALKSNATSRVKVKPPYGFLKGDEKVMLTIGTQPMSSEEAAELIKDRISVDYAILSADAPTEKFSLDLLENAQLRRRKNILVHYNC